VKRLGLLLLLAGGLACGRERREHVVIMRAMTFDPPSLVVASGDRVTWRNEDLVAHTATAPGGFDTGEVAAGGSYTVTVTQRGEVRYACRLHPTMLGVVEVK
jgi:plastocyanin